MAKRSSVVQSPSPTMNKDTSQDNVTPSAGHAKANDTFERVDSVLAGDIPPPIRTPDPSSSTVRVVQLHEWKEAAASLAESFANDATSKYFVDTPDRAATWTQTQKYTLHTHIMEYMTYAHLLKGRVLTCGPNYDCVALWMPPGANMDDTLTLFRSGMWRLTYLLCREGRKRFFSEFLPLLTDTKAAVLGPKRDLEAWYLVYIGTKPSGRGKGYAKKVIEYVTRRADREGRPCYLESSHAVNRAIYGRMGFEVNKCIYLQRADEPIELDIMVREPVRESRVDAME